MYFASLFSDIASLVLGISSLVIAVVALLISKKVYIHSSREFTPQLAISINGQHELLIRHSSQDLFRIEAIHFIMVRRVGFWYSNNKAYVQIPFVVRSKTFRNIEEDGKAKDILLTDNSPGPCAYNLCPYDEGMVNAIADRINQQYGPEQSKKGYAAPSMQGFFYTVEIIYCNKFDDRRSVVYKYEHFHGHGFDKTTIRPKDLQRMLQQSHIPAFDNTDSLWKYVLKKYKGSF